MILLIFLGGVWEVKKYISYSKYKKRPGTKTKYLHGVILQIQMTSYPSLGIVADYTLSVKRV